MKLFRELWPEKDIIFPETTWSNHFGLYKNVYPERTPKKYPYLNKETRGLDFDNMIKYLDSCDDQIILLQACAHNPSGVDPSKE